MISVEKIKSFTKDVVKLVGSSISGIIIGLWGVISGMYVAYTGDYNLGVLTVVLGLLIIVIAMVQNMVEVLTKRLSKVEDDIKDSSIVVPKYAKNDTLKDKVQNK